MKLAAERAVEMTGRSKTLRVSHRPWKSLRDSHIPTARLLLYRLLPRGRVVRVTLHRVL